MSATSQIEAVFHFLSTLPTLSFQISDAVLKKNIEIKVIFSQTHHLIRRSVKFMNTIRTTFQSQALIHFLSILPTLHSQISHSVLEWSNSASLRPRPFGVALGHLLCLVTSSLAYFSSSHWKCTVQWWDWSGHLTGTCRGNWRSFEHGKVDPRGGTYIIKNTGTTVNFNF